MPRYAQYDGDVITGLIDSAFPPPNSIEVSQDLADVPVGRMVFDGSSLQDAQNFDVFYVDEQGNKHVRPGPGRTEVDGRWDDMAVKDGKKFKLKSAAALRAEQAIEGVVVTKADAPRLALAIDRANRDPKFKATFKGPDGKPVKLSVEQLRKVVDTAMDRGVI